MSAVFLTDLSDQQNSSNIEANPHCPALPVFNIDAFLNAQDVSEPAIAQLCTALASCLTDAGALVIRDPRVDCSANETFIDLMERYFDQPTEAKMQDVHPELSYQVGATPECIEKPRCLHDKAIFETAAALPPEDRPHTPQSADVKWRFFWRIGERPPLTRFSELNAAPVVPEAFQKEWAAVMNGWGEKMVQSVETVS